MIIPRFGILVMLSVSFFIIGIAAAQSFSGPVFTSGSIWVDDEEENYSPFNESHTLPGSSGYIWAMTPNFTAFPTHGPVPLTVAFYDMLPSESGGFQWDFGDGTSSTARSPVHVYRTPGTYTVTLTVQLGNTGRYSQWSFKTTITKKEYIQATGADNAASLAAAEQTQSLWMSDLARQNSEQRIPISSLGNSWWVTPADQAEYQDSLFAQASGMALGSLGNPSISGLLSPGSMVGFS
jgi:hypothetical protein